MAPLLPNDSDLAIYLPLCPEEYYETFIDYMFSPLDEKPNADLLITTDDYKCHLFTQSGISTLIIYRADNLDELAGSCVHNMHIESSNAPWEIYSENLTYNGISPSLLPEGPIIGECLPRIVSGGLAYTHDAPIPVMITYGEKIMTYYHIPPDYDPVSWFNYVDTPDGIDIYFLDDPDDPFEGFCFIRNDAPRKAICY